MLFNDKPLGILLWVLLHMGQNVLWFWLLKYGGWEWANGKERGNKWADDTIMKKEALGIVAIIINILAVIGIFEDEVRVITLSGSVGFGMYSLLYFLGYWISLVILILKFINFMEAYLAYFRFPRKNQD